MSNNMLLYIFPLINLFIKINEFYLSIHLILLIFLIISVFLPGENASGPVNKKKNNKKNSRGDCNRPNVEYVCLYRICQLYKNNAIHMHYQYCYYFNKKYLIL